MSTNSTITIAVKDVELGKIKKINPNIVFDKEDIDVIDVTLAKRVKITKHYVTIYCHWDGYIEGNGIMLLQNFTTYNKVLNLILGGDIVSLGWTDVNTKEHKPLEYFIDKHKDRDKWDYVKPSQYNTLNDMLSNMGQQYNYLFENGEWFVQSRSEYGCLKFVPLKRVIMKRNKFMEFRHLIE